MIPKQNDEIYKEIPGYEGLYKISNYGNIYSIQKEQLLKPQPSHHNYQRIQLHKNGSHKSFAVHRLVAEAFVDNPNNYNEINHKNEITSDNYYKNLEWCSHDYNIHYGNRMSKYDLAKTPVIMMDMNGNEIARYKSQLEASKEIGISQGAISNACSGRAKTAGGAKWAYEQST